MLNHGRSAAPASCVILPVDQGFEHGPARSFAPNPAGYDPRYHFELADRRRLQRLRRAARLPRGGRGRVRRRDPADPEAQQLRLALRRHDPCPAITGSVERRAAPRLRGDRLHHLPGLVGAQRDVRAAPRADRGGEGRGARRSWSGPTRAARASRRRARRRSTSCAYAAQIAAQLGAHIIKVKPPTAHIEQDAAKKVYEKQEIPIGTLAERVRHVVQSAFDGRRIVIFSGGEAKDNEAVLDRDPRHPRRRRLRLDHRPQLLPAPEGRGDRAAARRDGHLPHDLARLTGAARRPVRAAS